MRVISISGKYNNKCDDYIPLSTLLTSLSQQPFHAKYNTHYYTHVLEVRLSNRGAYSWTLKDLLYYVRHNQTNAECTHTTIDTHLREGFRNRLPKTNSHWDFITTLIHKFLNKNPCVVDSCVVVLPTDKQDSHLRWETFLPMGNTTTHETTTYHSHTPNISP
jgi:hypothetical protein